MQRGRQPVNIVVRGVQQQLHNGLHESFLCAKHSDVHPWAEQTGQQTQTLITSLGNEHNNIYIGESKTSCARFRFTRILRGENQKQR